MFGLPTGNGKLKDLSRFDAAMFGVHPKQAHAMDPQLRMLLEVVYEAIADAGSHCPFQTTSDQVNATRCEPEFCAWLKDRSVHRLQRFGESRCLVWRP